MKAEEKSKKIPNLSLPVSLALHAALLLLIGGAVVIQKNIETAPTPGALYEDQGTQEPAPVDPVDEALPDPSAAANTLDMESAPAGEAGPDAMSDMLVVEAPSTFSVSPGLNPNSLSLSGVSSGGKGDGGGGNGGKGGGGSVRVAKKLFGTEVEAQRLGVLIDVSGTATPYILPTLKEVQKNFDNPVIVLVCGCALSVPRGEAKPFSSFDLSIPSPVGPAGYNALGYIKGTMKLDDKVARLMKDLQKSPDAWLMEGNGLDVMKGMEKLVAEKVDAIYWFSDFRDGVNEEQAKKLAADLKSRGIKLYLHTFTGEPIPPVQTAMTVTTGGKTIVKVPK